VHPLAGTWVGLDPSGATARIAVVHVAEEGAVSLDLPAAGVFRLPATLHNGELSCSTRERDVRLRLGPGGLEREVTMSAAELAAIRGTYAAPHGDAMLVSSRELAGSGVPFIFEPRHEPGAQVTRLHPVGDGRFWSERADLVTLIPGDPRSVLRVQGPSGTMELRPAVLYGEEPLTWTSSDITLHGTLLLPPGETPAPCVILMHGTEPGTRDFYRMFAHSFVMAGMAALVFDKRGFGESGGSADSLIRDRADDVAAAIRALRTHPRIDSANIGLWAFSNGTWSAPMVAAGTEDVCFVVLVGAAGVSPAEAETHRKLLELREWHIPEATVERVRRAWTLAYRCVVGEWDNAWEAEYDALMAELHADRQLAAIPLADYAQRNPWLAPVPPNFPSAALREMAFGQFPEMGYDPCPDLARTRAPVLFVIGEEDTNTPGREGARRVREALDRAGNPASRVELIPNAGHFLNEMVPISGMSAAEAAGELHRLRFVPGYFELVTAWVLEQIRT
jgi:pimeloyl-ACP methyl ester carboxylesterase